MLFIRTNGKEGSEELMNGLRRIAEGKYAEITKDDYISVFFKSARRTRFSVQIKGIIFECREIHMVNQGDKENREYTYIFLDNNSLNLKEVEINWDNSMSVEIVGI